MGMQVTRTRDWWIFSTAKLVHGEARTRTGLLYGTDYLYSHSRDAMDSLCRGILYYYMISLQVHSHPAIPDLDNPDTSLIRMNFYEF